MNASGLANVARTFDANLSLSTQIFGTARFKLGALRGVRHIVTPSVNIGYTPDYSKRPFDYYRQVQVNPAGEVRDYTIFPNQPFSPGNIPNEMALRIGYSLGNRFETKIQGRNDSTSRIVTAINNLSFSGNYNLQADSLNWSPISVSGAQLSLLNNLIRINFGGALDVYALNEDRRRINTTLLDAGQGLFRVDRFNFAINTGTTLGELRKLVVGEDKKLPANSIFSLIERFRLSYNYSRSYTSTAREPWRTQANAVNVSGGLPITNKWSIGNLTLGYDFVSERITYPSVSLRRDLHCWEMDFAYFPALGNTFNFSIRVKPSSLDFLELPYRRNPFR